MRALARKIMSPAEAETFLKKASRGRRRVVFTNGCFDILHPGHVRYLEDARRSGDLLVVAVDTDAAVRALKGSGRPVNPLRSRMQVVAALESVDVVTWFGGGNPLALIKRLRPDVLVKGGDWEVAKIIGSREVLGWGGKVHSLPFVKGKSTTRIIGRIRRA